MLLNYLPCWALPDEQGLFFYYSICSSREAQFDHRSNLWSCVSLEIGSLSDNLFDPKVDPISTNKGVDKTYKNIINNRINIINFSMMFVWSIVYPFSYVHSR